MATFNQRDIHEVVIGGQATKSTGSIATMNDGEVAVFAPGGTMLTEALAASADKFMLVRQSSQASGDPVLMTGVFKTAAISNGVLTEQSNAVEQITYVGYNGTSGSIEVINDNLYHIRINLNQAITSNIGGLYVKHGVFESGTSDTQASIAAGLAISVSNDFSKETDRQVRAQRACAEASTGDVSGTGTVTWVQDSIYVQCATDADAVVSIGDYVRHNSSTTSATYQIVDIDTTNNIWTLDQPVQTDSGTSADTAVFYIDQATAEAGDWGVRLEGQELAWRLGKLNYAVVRYVATLENFGTTILTDTGADNGTGNYEQIAELEWFSKGNEGDYFRMGEPNLYDKNYKVETDIDYDQIDITFSDSYTGSIVTGPIKKSLTLCIPTTTPDWAANATADNIPVVLEVLVFGASNGDFNVG